MSDERLGSEEGESGATSRRALFAGAGALGATAVLAGCGSDPSYQDRDPYSPAPPAGGDDRGSADGTAAPDSGDDTEGDEGDEGGDDADGGDVLAAAADVEVGGGLILEDQGVVITQPTQGEWRGFSASCTHQGCPVAEVAGGTINCTCHGSQFSIEDGSVVRGPASQPLDERPVTADGDRIYLA